MTHVPYDQGVKGTPHRVIADHLRALVFAIGDGATPGNEGRGYVLRRILRRASRFSQDLDQKKPFIFKLVPRLVEIMGGAYPEIRAREDFIGEVIEAEETRFMRTLKDGLIRFHKILQETKDRGQSEIKGADSFQLYDTYGFPSDLTRILADEKGFTIDQPGFDAAMNEQKERARNAAKFSGTLSGDEGWTVLYPQQGTQFVGYETNEVTTKVLRYQEVGDDILVVLEKSPFYAESGGQVGDVGEIESLHKAHPLNLRVVDTFKVFDTQIHRCHLVQGLLAPKALESVLAKLDLPSRASIVRHHSVTHLLHAALRKVLGSHVTQQGSRVAAEALRFDFTHPKALGPGELREVERLVNLEILANYSIAVRQSPIDEAKAEGATALFGEKYGDVVRHIKMGDFSHELCGGTHAKATGDLGSFRILNEMSIASGIRRIEAVAGLAALERAQNDQALISDLTRHFKIRPEELGPKISEYELKIKELEKELKVFRDARLLSHLKVLLGNKKAAPQGLDLLVQKLDAKDFPKDQLQAVLEHCADRLNNGVAIMTHIEDGLLTILVAVGVEARKKYKAGDLVRELSEVAGGKGGGRPDRAQAGSKFPERESLVWERALALFS
jgi:alanyl-tRNA synthetase